MNERTLAFLAVLFGVLSYMAVGHLASSVTNHMEQVINNY